MSSVFGIRLKQARVAAGITQEKLGVAAGIDEASASARMNQYEKGTHAPNYEMSEKFAKVLGVPVEYLYARNDDVASLLLSFHKLDKEGRAKALRYIAKAIPK
jgi:transcriptional regulator with XRE-family HTH domain